MTCWDDNAAPHTPAGTMAEQQVSYAGEGVELHQDMDAAESVALAGGERPEAETRTNNQEEFCILFILSEKSGNWRLKDIYTPFI